MLPQIPRLVLFTLLTLLFVSCAEQSVQTSDCQSAAVAQASAELELNALILEQPREVIPHTHDESARHAHPEDQILAARIDVILAEATTRAKCG